MTMQQATTLLADKPMIGPFVSVDDFKLNRKQYDIIRKAAEQIALSKYTFKQASSEGPLYISKEILIFQLSFRDNEVIYIHDESKYVLKLSGISKSLDKKKYDIEGPFLKVKIKLNTQTKELVLNPKVCNFLWDYNKKVLEQELEEAKNTESVPFSSFSFEEGHIILKLNNKEYIRKDVKIRNYKQIVGLFIKSLTYSEWKKFRDFRVKVSIDNKTNTFDFVNFNLHEYVKKMKGNLPTSIIATLRSKQTLSMTIDFSSLKFYNGEATYKYRGIIYKYKNESISDFYKIINKYKNHCSLIERRFIEELKVLISLDKEKQEFSFIDLNLIDYVNGLKQKIENPEFKNDKSEGENAYIAQKDDCLCIDNLEFFDGYYLLWVLKKGQKDYSIAPLRITDDNSFSCLRFVLKYFIDRFPKNIQIIYTDKYVIGLSKSYVLSNYVRTLHDNMDIHGDWWEEVQNERKPSLTTCRNTPAAVVKKKVSLRSGYIDNLASMQNNQKLIPVYEINHGNQEDAFIFTVSLPKDRCAIIFENVSAEASTATEVFIAKTENYESCLSMVFDYFTDYTISTKRDSLRRGVNPPNKFKAEQFYSVVHGELETWLIKMNQILERTPHKSKIEFVSGLHVPQDIASRSGHKENTPKNVHNELMRNLYSKLCIEYGTDNVGTEIRIGSKRIDAVVKSDNNYDIYEIKSDPDPFTCVTIALGQICQYAYLYCRDKIGKMVIVGATAASPEVEQYLSWFRKKHSMEVYYMKI